MIVAPLYGLIAWATMVAYPERQKWVCFAAAVALALGHLGLRLARGETLKLDLADALLTALILWAAISLGWSANRNGGVQTVIIASACLGLAVSLKNCGTRGIFLALCVGAGIGDLSALALNFWTGPEQWSRFGNRDYAVEALTLAIPFMWPLWKWGSLDGKALALVVTLANLGYAVGFTPSLIEWFVAGTFLAIATIALAFRRDRRLGWAVVAAWALLPPLAAWAAWGPLRLNDRLLIRTELWVNAGFMFLASPFVGIGAGSFIEVYPLYKEAHGDLMPFVSTAFESYVTEAEAAHDDPLQLWIELGTVAVPPFMALVVTLVRAAARRVTVDPIAAAGGAAVITVLAESLIEYPFQRAATLFLAALGMAMAMHGLAAGRAVRTFRLPRAATVAALPVGVALAAGLMFAALRQNEAEDLLERAKAPNLPSEQALQYATDALRLDPLERHARTALPVLLGNVVREKGAKAVPRERIDAIFAAVDDGGHFNTSALVARSQILLKLTNGEDPSFEALLKDLERGSSRVAAVYMVEAQNDLAHERYLATLNAVAEGRKYTEGVSAIPTADAAIKATLDDLEKSAKAGLELQRQVRQRIEQQNQQAQPTPPNPPPPPPPPPPQ